MFYLKLGWLMLAMILYLPVQAQEDVPRFEPSRCTFRLPADYTPECGYLIVPENRADPTGDTVRVAVAIFRSEHAEPDPVIYVADGPGDETLSRLWLNMWFTPLLENHDVILFDPRGAGYSQPTLFCQDYIDAYENSLSQDVDDAGVLDQAIQTCHDRLTGEGVDFSAFTTDALVADIDDLRVALGYETVNLVGKGYGAQLAQAVALNHPENVRTVTYIRITDEALDSSNNLLDLDALNKAIDALNAQPLRFTAGNESLTVVLNGERFHRLITWMLEDSELIPVIPIVIEEVSAGNTATVERLEALMLQDIDARSWGLYYAALPPLDQKVVDIEPFAMFRPTYCGGLGEAVQFFLTYPEQEETSDKMCGFPSPEIPMLRFSSEAINMSGAAPAGWAEAQPGVYVRSEESYDALIFSQQPFSTIDEALTVIQEQLGLDAPPDPVDAITINGINWRIYQVPLEDDGIVIDLAMAEVEGLVYFVNLVSETANTQTYHDLIFIPAVEHTTIP